MIESQPTRALLIRLLRQRGGCTVTDLQGLTGLSRSALRQHLTVLERDGLIRERLGRAGVGRPPIIYEPTSDILPPSAPGTHTEDRIRQALATLLEGAVVSVGRRADGQFEVIIEGCPLTPLSSESTAACEITRRLLGALVEAETEQREWIVRGDRRCVFVLHGPGGEPPGGEATHGTRHQEEEDGPPG